MKRFNFILIVFLLINRCVAFDLTRRIGGRAAAMGRTAVTERSIWALQNNPAGMAYLKGWHFGLYYENPWMLKATAIKSGCLVKNMGGIGCIGLSVSQFGGSGYSENKFGIAYARNFGPYLQMGLTVDYLRLHWDELYPAQNGFCIEYGIMSQLTKKLRVGAYIFNPTFSKFTTLNDDPIPIVMRFGVCYQFTDDFNVQCEMGKNSEKTGIQLCGGLEYILFEKFCLRAGVQHNPNLMAFGLGYEIQGLHVDVAAQMHQVLGASIQIGISFGIGK